MTQWLDYAAAYGRSHSVSGTVKVLRQVQSSQLHNRRDLLVYLPPSWESGGDFPVIYMHDGQNLFDRATSFAGEWAVDKTLDEAAADGLEVIVVGIPNMGSARVEEYSPFGDATHGGGRGDAYLDFISDTVRAIVERDFPVRRGPAHTGIAGSSMGGLISLYGFLRRPDTYGFASAMSPSLWFGRRAIFDEVAALHGSRGRLYLDIGTGESPVAVADARRLCTALVRKGYRRGRDLRFVVDRGGRHNEQAWGRRLRRALEFLLRD
ncbi:MAG: alpha/beta hydrolase [Longimicrobiales bacterium]